MIVDFIRGPEELHVVHFHASCLPDFHKVATNHTDLIQITYSKERRRKRKEY